MKDNSTAKVEFLRTRDYGTVEVLGPEPGMPPESLFLSLWHGVVLPVEAAHSAELYADLRLGRPAAFPKAADIIAGTAGPLEPFAELTCVGGRSIVSSTRQQAMIVCETVAALRAARDELAAERDSKTPGQAAEDAYLDAWYARMNASLAWVADNLRLDMAAYFFNRCVEFRFEFAPASRGDSMCRNIIGKICSATHDAPTPEILAANVRIIGTIVGWSRQEPDAGFDPAYTGLRFEASKVLRHATAGQQPNPNIKEHEPCTSLTKTTAEQPSQ